MEAVEGIKGDEGSFGREEGDMERQRRTRYAVVIWFVTGDRLVRICKYSLGT